MPTLSRKIHLFTKFPDWTGLGLEVFPSPSADEYTKLKLLKALSRFSLDPDRKALRAEPQVE